MRYKIDHDFHIHSKLSSCSKDEAQTPERILQYAKDNRLSRICITDHYWDSAIEGASSWYAPQNFEHISRSLPLPKADGIDFLFGCECDMDKHKTIGLPLSRFDDFDFVIIPTTHLHMKKFTIEEEDYCKAERVAKLWGERFSALLDMPLPFGKLGVAHLCAALMNKTSREEYIATLDLIPSDIMEELFAKAAKLGCGIELNFGDMSFADSEADSVLRPFKIAKAQGCKFYLGSDAHHPEAFDRAKEIFERAVTMLDLCENDKFIL
jgi:histidinol phosphatase-like PHP family hydrolase